MPDVGVVSPNPENSVTAVSVSAGQKPTGQAKPTRWIIAGAALPAQRGEPGFARNSTYTKHRAVIDALRQAAQRRVVPSKLESWKDKLAQQRAVIDVLKTEQRRLVTENAALLKLAVDAETAAALHQRRTYACSKGGIGNAGP